VKRGRFAKALLTVGLVMSLLFLPGCWSRRELNEIGIVSQVGVDLNEQKKIVLTIQVINPSGMKKQGSGGASVRIVTSEGNTVFEAIRNLMLKSGVKLFYPHNHILVMGEDLARSGLGPAVDFFIRDPEIRLTTWVLLTPGKAEEIVKASSDEEKLPAIHLDRLLQDYRVTSKSVSVNLLDFSSMLMSEEIQPVAGRVETVKQKDEETFALGGSGAFREDKLIAWLTPEETRGYQWVRDNIKGGILTAPSPKAPEEKDSSEGAKLPEQVSFEIIRSKTKIKPVLEENTLHFDIDVDVTCNLGEQMGNETYILTQDIQLLEETLGGVVNQEIQGILRKAQQDLKIDILGLGQTVARENPDYWKQVKEEWEEKYFTEVEIFVKVTPHVKFTGMVK
jgi:spore germination protein KC